MKVRVHLDPSKMDPRYNPDGWYIIDIGSDGNGSALDSEDCQEYSPNTVGADLASSVIVSINGDMLERDGLGNDVDEVGWLAQIFRTLATWLEENATDALDRKMVDVDLLSIMATDGIDMDVWGDALSN